ncbi:hypothetical protein, partial [Moorena sp. SIO2C4]|uniref:hypothetical protein n=1 Tax=Moorena sp. SIO2C4 TaxID=2607824 RepID=UPI00257AC268
MNLSPLAVRLPWKPEPYQEAIPLTLHRTRRRLRLAIVGTFSGCHVCGEAVLFLRGEAKPIRIAFPWRLELAEALFSYE